MHAWPEVLLGSVQSHRHTRVVLAHQKIDGCSKPTKVWMVCHPTQLFPGSYSTCRKMWLSRLPQVIAHLWLFVPASVCLPNTLSLPKMCMPMSHLVALVTVVPQLGGHVDVFALDEAFLQRQLRYSNSSPCSACCGWGA